MRQTPPCKAMQRCITVKCRGKWLFMPGKESLPVAEKNEICSIIWKNTVFFITSMPLPGTCQGNLHINVASLRIMHNYLRQ
jgi:hypothetical protein